jgi:HD-GYP domain-containing protein (c-di-GMP phosphodiesterase class II)
MTATPTSDVAVLLAALRKASPAESARIAARLAALFQAERRPAVLEIRGGAPDPTQPAEGLLALLVDAVEARERFFHGHSRRVALLSTSIARIIDVPESEAASIHVAALFHDVGMCYPVFADITKRSDRLAPTEWNIVKTHPLLGADLLDALVTLRTIAPIVLHHHENWDGTGYPAGLLGERIPLGARIILIAEAIDAMATDRPYRSALDYETSRLELIRVAGRQCDPEICKRILVDEVWTNLCDLHKHSIANVGPVGEKAMNSPPETKEVA